MSDHECKRLMSELYFHRALIWFAVAWFTENKAMAIVFCIPLAANVWRSYEEWPK